MKNRRRYLSHSRTMILYGEWCRKRKGRGTMTTPRTLTPNNHLAQERVHREWTQREVADRLGTTSLTVSRWERGVIVPRAFFRERLSQLFEWSAQKPGIEPETRGSDRGKPSRNPTPQNRPAQATLLPRLPTTGLFLSSGSLAHAIEGFGNKGCAVSSEKK